VAGGAPWLLFPAYARLAGVDLRTVRWVHAEAAQLPPALAAGRVEGIGTFVVARPSVEKAARGRTVVVLPYSDVLTDLYGNALLAATRVVRDDPDLVRRFAQALLKGLVYAVEHPEEAGQILHRRVPAQDPATAAAELTLMRPYVRVNGAVGAIEPTRVARAIAILSGAGVLTGPLEPDDVVAFDTTVGGVR
jgi:NitT/TauT family transport system substrate-binding protein